MMDTNELQTKNERQWITFSNNTRLLFEQNELLKRLNDNGIFPVAIGDSAAAIYYSDPLKRKLEEIDLFIDGNHIAKAGQICSAAGYLTFTLPEDHGNCFHFIRNNITIHLHKRIELLAKEEDNNLLNNWIVEAASSEANIGKYIIPVLPYWINGLLQLAFLKAAISRNYIRKRLIDDWTMFVKANLSDSQWGSFREKTDCVGLTEIARSATYTIKKAADLDITWCDDASKNLNRIIYDEQIYKSEEKHSESKKSWRRILYDTVKSSPLRFLFYHLQDMFFVVSYKMMGKARIQPEDIENVEKNVTFIYKSFNRQKQAKRLYKNIKTYYPKARIIIADDSKVPLDLPEVIYLPFNSGLSKGLNSALDQVVTTYVVRLDDDMLLTPHSDIHQELKFLMRHPEVDLVAVMADHKRPEEYSRQYRKVKYDKKLLIPAGAEIDGKIVAYKTPNSFIARTQILKQVGYDPNIRLGEHHDFFYRAAGQMVSVLDCKAYIMHCHNLFERSDYRGYRNDIEKATQYITNKHKSKFQH